MDEIYTPSAEPAPLPGGAGLNSIDVAALLRPIERWLDKARPWHLRFPAALEAIFERDTGAPRRKMLATVVFAGSLAFLLWDLTGFVSNVDPHGRFLHALLIAPAGIVGAAALRHRLSAKRRETLAGIIAASSGVSMSLLWASGAWPDIAMANTGVILTMLIANLVEQLRFPYAVASSSVILGVHGASILLGPAVPVAIAAEVFETAAIAMLVSLFAAWRQERELRSTYLLALRERLRGDALSVHNRALDDLARRDQLTGLPNRRAFDLWLDEPPLARNGGNAASLIVLDIDHFKLYNDHYGHPAGDTCLRRVAACLRDELRSETDFVARVGGEEFAVLLPGIGLQAASATAERLRSAVASMGLPHHAPGAAGVVTISAGVACAPWLEKALARSLVLRADAALYRAKQTGRNHVCVDGDVSRAATAT